MTHTATDYGTTMFTTLVDLRNRWRACQADCHETFRRFADVENRIEELLEFYSDHQRFPVDRAEFERWTEKETDAFAAMLCEQGWAVMQDDGGLRLVWAPE